MRPGEQLKAIRARLGISIREVELRSRQIAHTKGNADYAISNARLIQIENRDSVPSITKLYSLAAIMRMKFSDLIRLYDVDIDRMHDDQMSVGLSQTRLVMEEGPDDDSHVAFPTRFDPGCNLQSTTLLSRIVEVWGEVPVAFLRSLGIRHHQYGIVGLKDFTMHPLLRPGAFVQIDQSARKVQSFAWRTEYDRPIYFIELRNGYACSWCEVLGSQLILVPHPLSPCGLRQLEFGRDAEIVGRVTAIATRVGTSDSEGLLSDGRLGSAPSI